MVIPLASARLEIEADFIGDIGGGIVNKQIEQYPYINQYLQEHFKEKFLKDGKLDATFKDAFMPLTGFSEQEIVDLLSDPENGPTIYFYGLSEINQSNMYVDPQGEIHGFINGQTLTEYKPVEGSLGQSEVGYASHLKIATDGRSDRGGVILIDNLLANSLEFALGGNVADHGISQNVPTNDKARDEKRNADIKTAELIFESTMLHEFVHWARYKNKLPNELTAEEALKYKHLKSADAGKIFEILYYGQDIKERIHNVNWGKENFPVKEPDGKDDEHLTEEQIQNEEKKNKP